MLCLSHLYHHMYNFFGRLGYKIKTVKSLIFQFKLASAIKYAGFLFYFVTVPQYIIERVCVHALAQAEKIGHQQAEFKALIIQLLENTLLDTIKPAAPFAVPFIDCYFDIFRWGTHLTPHKIQAA